MEESDFYYTKAVETLEQIDPKSVEVGKAVLVALNLLTAATCKYLYKDAVFKPYNHRTLR